MTEAQHTEADFASSTGRIHCHQWKPASSERSAPDLVLLHPMPHSGLFFKVIAPLLAVGRTVIAPDYPGYGESGNLEGIPTIGAYAEAMVEALRARGGQVPVDLFGFHTGCLVAVDMSLRHPGEVRRLVQVDVPYFDSAKRQELMASDYAVGGFIAAFSYVGEKQYPLVQHDCLMIATASSLLEPTRAASAALPGGRLQEMPEVGEPALENGAGAISESTLNFLDS